MCFRKCERFRGVQIQANSASGYALTTSTAQALDDTTIVIQLSTADLNVMKFNGTGASSSSSYLTASSGATNDTAALRLGYYHLDTPTHWLRARTLMMTAQHPR